MSDNKVCKSKYCISCGKRMFDGYIVEGVIKFMCKCGVLNIIEAVPKKQSPKAQEPQY